ncbi:MAG: hypothetical protein AABY22_14445 [Nanoarchaeota archaeon]
MTAPLSIDQVKQKISKIHSDQIVVDELTYKRTDIKCRFIDKDYGEFWSTPNNVFNGRSHPNRKIEKTKQTCLERYGVENFFNIKEIRKKSIDSRKISIKQVKQKLFNVHGDIVILDESTYKNVRTKARFIDKEYGDWWSKPDNILYGRKGHPKRGRKKTLDAYLINLEEIIKKREETNLKKYGFKCNLQNRKVIEQGLIRKYGVDNPQKIKEISLRSAKTKNQITILNHWKNNSEIWCRGSWEVLVARFLNKNKIDYNWQPQTFTMPDTKTYTPDLYLIKENKWIEIKGRFYDDAKEKWDWFHENYPNSELWNKERLKEMKIL